MNADDEIVLIGQLATEPMPQCAPAVEVVTVPCSRCERLVWATAHVRADYPSARVLCAGCAVAEDVLLP